MEDLDSNHYEMFHDIHDMQDEGFGTLEDTVSLITCVARLQHGLKRCVYILSGAWYGEGKLRNTVLWTECCINSSINIHAQIMVSLLCVLPNKKLPIHFSLH